MKKVLVVEDDLDNQMYIKILLNKKNIDIISVIDGSNVITTFKNNINDIAFVMMDINLPGTIYTGIDFIKMMLEIKNIPIIIQTAYSERREEAINAGCSDYITKPFNTHQINKLIDKYYI